MNALSLYVDYPPAGVTYALPELDAPAVFKKAVLEKIAAADWSRYYKIPLKAIGDGPYGWILNEECSLVFTHGAESGLLSLAKLSAVDALLCPKNSYPGYRRIASLIGARLIEYSSSEDIRQQLNGPLEANKTMVLVTTPGNPCDNSVQTSDWKEFSSSLLVIDCAYAWPTDPRFKANVRIANEIGAYTVFSLSKPFPLAGFRLGGVTQPYGKPQLLPLEERFWTLVSCAVLETLAESRHFEMLSEARDERESIKTKMLVQIRALGLECRGSESSLFLTVDSHDITSQLQGKKYGTSLFRLDVSSVNLAKMETLTRDQFKCEVP